MRGLHGDVCGKSKPDGVVLEARIFFSGRSGFNTKSLCDTAWFVFSVSLMVEPSRLPDRPGPPSPRFLSSRSRPVE